MAATATKRDRRVLPSAFDIMDAFHACEKGIDRNDVRGSSMYDVWRTCTNSYDLEWFLDELDLSGNEFIDRFYDACDTVPDVILFDSEQPKRRNQMICTAVRRLISWQEIKDALLNDYRVRELLEDDETFND